jgi:hypothetical protein
MANLVTDTLIQGLAHGGDFTKTPVGAGVKSVIDKATPTAGSIINGAERTVANALPSALGYVDGSDPYAQFGGQAAYNKTLDRYGAQKNTIYDTVGQGAENTAVGLKNSILDLVDSARTGQTAIDNRAINNELARQRGTSDVYGSIGRGIRSGGVTLSNRNAGDSSAAGAIARAYGDIGRRELSDIGNQYELENQDIGLAQNDLNRQVSSGRRRILGSREQAINSLVSDAQNQLAALDAAMENAGLLDRLDLESEKNNVRKQVLAKLADFDSDTLDAKLGGIDPMNQNARIAEATRRGSLGMAPDNAFDYSTDVPAQFQNTGPFASELPIFTFRNRNDQ